MVKGLIMARRVPDLFLEQLRLDELPPEDARRLRAEIEASSEAAKRLSALESADRKTLDRYPAPEVAREALRRHHQSEGEEGERRLDTKRRRHWRLAVALPAVAAAGLALWIAPPLNNPLSDGSTDLPSPAFTGPTVPHDLSERTNDTTRQKGAPRLLLHRQRAGQPELLLDPVRANAGDVVQISYIAAGAAHGVILSIDGRGAVTLHHPDTQSDPTDLNPGGRVALAHAYELDDAPRFERFWLVTGRLPEDPIDVASVLEAARALARDAAVARTADLDLDSAISQTSFIVEKAEEAP